MRNQFKFVLPMVVAICLVTSTIATANSFRLTVNSG